MTLDDSVGSIGSASDSTPGPAPAVTARGRRRDRSLGSLLFQHRGKIHVPFLFAAVWLGGASTSGMLLGGALLAIYLGIRLWCSRYIRGAARVHARKAQERKVLVTGGPFRWVRNPLYVCNSAGLAGTCLLLGPTWLAALAAAASLAWYHFVVRWEEKVLGGLYPESYPAYVRAVPRFVPRPWRRELPPATDDREPLAWGEAVRRERGALAIASFVVVLAMARRLFIG